MMKFLLAEKFESRKEADLLVLPFWKGKKEPTPAGVFPEFKELLHGPFVSLDFSGKEGEVLILYVAKQPEMRVALIGLGEPEDLTAEKLRRFYANVAKACHSRKIKTANLLVPKTTFLSEESVVRGVAEGLLLPNYVFTKLKQTSLKEGQPVLLEKVTLIHANQHTLNLANKFAAICQGVYFARDLVNGNADDVTPQHLARVAQGLAKKHPHVKATVLDRKRIEKEGMGLLLAVNRGSNREPAFIILEYRGNPKSKDHTVLVGKGITYDTGGLNLKPTGSMETMKCDMSGAAVCLGAVVAAEVIGLKANFTVVIPSTENSIGEKSYKPGDVYSSYAGTTVEIGNTDAEGRLVLADALSYACKKLKPTRIIDFATLTGAIDIALGNEAAGLMSNDDALADALIRAGSETFERVWRLPLYPEYREQLKSDIADIKNIGGRSAGSITAAKFLEEFVGKTPWAHFDIASSSFLAEGKRYLPKFATGMGVRLIIEFLEQQA